MSFAPPDIDPIFAHPANTIVKVMMVYKNPVFFNFTIFDNAQIYKEIQLKKEIPKFFSVKKTLGS